MALLTHLIALFAGVALGFLICCLFASRTRSHNLEIDDDELLKQLTGDDDPPYRYKQ